MLINNANLRTLGTGFNGAYKRGLGQAASMLSVIATTINSTTSQNEYGWLGKMKGMREWLGDRVVNSIATHGYTIKNKDWEDTVEVDRNDIEDDNIGIYSPLFEEMGRATAAHPDELAWSLLRDGFNQLCYDGQNFFDTDHPVLDANGDVQSVSNSGGGAGTPWFLIDDTRALKPIIFQQRKAAQFVSKDSPTDENVFRRKKFLYGVDARYNVGFGYWQFAYGSKQALDAAAYAAARAAMQGMKGDYGRPLGLKPTLLVVPPALEAAGLEILNAERDAGGATNVWKGTAKLVVVPWLA
ncbi:Mu-like prophage major head subunit gpT family protein [Sphingopyxis alaskensis]|uniref:Mu-like prophage major head subunit gpT family protein n=1 Tax=Sphingopyxis alaskensis TaxID=117207 RepID=UPI00203C73EE|nr:Mu-like prophage major head subunit gpT family protein [Sphingopyxis alaskensis]MCM3419050.1 Mu-like prophage major head subunit gpT family protein [Sphingopyxis alaskensis]